MLYEYLRKFGIGEYTGVELPSESRGMLRKLDCETPEERRNPAGHCWSPDSHEYIAFGHEVGATAVQLARAISVVANGGMKVQPHLVSARTRPRPDGSFEPMPVERCSPERVLPPETCFTVRRIMQRVVLEGTGRGTAPPGYSAGGKTGSAQIFKDHAWTTRHNSSFIGFAPVVNPRVVVVVTLNNTPKLGGVAAGPVFRQVAETALRVLHVPKDMPETDVAPKSAPKQSDPEQPAPPRAEPTPEPAPVTHPQLLAGPRVPDFRGKSVVEATREALAMGMQVETTGRGLARRQQPAPGAILASGERIKIEFSVRQ
jgi:cell division protein FtsI (penicillin-binding protein 3)